MESDDERSQTNSRSLGDFMYRPTQIRLGLGSTMFDDLHYSQMSQHHILDMRKSQVFTVSEAGPQVKATLTDEQLKVTLSKAYDTTVEKVIIEHLKMKIESSAVRTIAIILPENLPTIPYRNLLIEAYADDERSPRILCGLWKSDATINEFRQRLMEFLGWKWIALCIDGRILCDSFSCEQSDSLAPTKIQAYQFGPLKVTLVYNSKRDSEHRFTYMLNGTKTVMEAKMEILAKNAGELEAIAESKGQTLHLCIRDNILEDDVCLGVALRGLRDESVGVHFASEDAITVYLKLSKELRMKQSLLIVPRQCSTAYLREKIGKLSACQPKSIKLVFNEKLMDEHEDLSETYDINWKSGCIVNVGLKKQKTLKIKNPKSNKDLVVKMYMLESVDKLMENISEKWKFDRLTMCLYCRNIPMKCNSLLQHYPIKNNMQLELKLFPNRIAIQVRIIFKKQRLNLVIEDSTQTTVEDLLTYCAVKLQYSRKYSRAILQNKCLTAEAFLKDEGFCTGDRVLIVFFDDPLGGNNELMPVFLSDGHGHTVSRCGKVAGGVLLLASKSKLMPPLVNTFENGYFPRGIDLHDEVMDLTGEKKAPLCEKTKPKEKKQSDDSIKDMKQKFLQRSKSVMDALKQDIHHQIGSLFPPETKAGSFQKKSSGTSLYKQDVHAALLTNKPREFQVEKEDTGSKNTNSEMFYLSSDSQTGIALPEPLEQCSSSSESDLPAKCLRSSESDLPDKCLHSDEKPRKSGDMCEKNVVYTQNEDLDVNNTNAEKVMDQFPDSIDINEIENDGVLTLVPEGSIKSQSEHISSDQTNNKSQNTSSSNVLLKTKVECIIDCAKYIKSELSNATPYDLNSCLPLKQSENYNIISTQDYVIHAEGMEAGAESIKSSTVQMPSTTSNVSGSQFAPITSPSRNIDGQIQIRHIAGHQNMSSFTDSDKSRTSTPNPHCWQDMSVIGHNNCPTCGCQQVQLSMNSWNQFVGQCSFVRRKLFQGTCQRPRIHCISEGDADHHCAETCLHRSHTYPEFTVDLLAQAREFLDTSGISPNLMLKVSNLVGNEWKTVLRRLGVNDTLIDNFDHQFPTIKEKLYQGLLHWKRSNGIAATFNILETCLKESGLTYVAEQISGNFTT
ncbi:hypothetical protein DPMN_103850 [Dreissena polymorpha]|uniref:Death domain-containing protein n=2 Tax=Dreissena polymorpha TaxID=45954 RepID=A0A9D4H8U2_DREPO|nr:hypothetical protein DPMN_103850 [Dreissena polymorpha]